MAKIFYLAIFAVLVCGLNGSVLIERVKRQFGPFDGQFGPTSGPQFGQGNSGFFQGNFAGFDQQGSRGVTIPGGRGNIIPRQVNTNDNPQQQQQPNRQSPAYRRCLAGCPTTNEYNPVCGSDSQDYYNQQRLDCAIRCGMNVSALRRGTCNAM